MKTTIYLLCIVSLLWYGCGAGDTKNVMKAAKRAASNQQWASVRELTEKRLRAVPTDNDASVLLALSLFYTDRGNPTSIDRAINCMRQVLTRETQRYDLHFVYGWILLNTGRTQEARVPLQAAYDLHFKDPHTMGQDSQGLVKYALGRCCMMNSLFADALKYYEQAVKSTGFNDWVTLYNDMACCHAFLGNYASAMECMNLALQKDAQNKAALAKERAKKKDAPLYENPYEYLLTVNTAVVCDYLSYPQLNPDNASAYRAVRVGWYDKAAATVAEVAKNSSNASQQQRLYNLAKQINQRKATLQASK
ncbi:MAG: hypothetical protein IKR81_07440 [Victivallales bacterium]|nr:hypothetical protein [Victivallales bacterium]